MELLQLRYFYESAINESFSKTAQNHIVPTTSVSASVKRLEKELGCQLFVRSSNRIWLSEEGKRFFESVRDMFADLDRGVAGVKVEQEEGPIRLLVLDMRDVITDLVIRYRELNPATTFYMTMNRKNITPEDYDIIIDETCDFYSEWEQVSLGEYRLRFCSSERNPICTRPVTLRQLSEQGFIAFEDNGNLYQRLMHAYESRGFTPKLVAMCNDVRCYQRLLAADMGVALLKEVPRPPEGTRFVTVADFNETIRFAAYYRSERMNKKKRAFVEFLERELFKANI